MATASELARRALSGPTSARSPSSPAASSSPPSSSAALLIVRSQTRSVQQPGRRRGHATWPPRSPRSPRSWPSSRSWPPRAGPPAWPTWSWPSIGPRRATGPRPSPILGKLPAGPQGPRSITRPRTSRPRSRSGRKDYDKAIAIYTKIGDEKPKAYPLDAARFRLAEMPRAQGRHRDGPRALQEAPDGVPPVLLRLRGLAQGRASWRPEK
ncbi:MAG: hypothetical protein MZU95_01425 [Desulfomicrobium escambiense]|nr:hypothetical protein [Desulfomicrobium escambiense]